MSYLSSRETRSYSGLQGSLSLLSTCSPLSSCVVSVSLSFSPYTWGKVVVRNTDSEYLKRFQNSFSTILIHLTASSSTERCSVLSLSSHCPLTFNAVFASSLFTLYQANHCTLQVLPWCRLIKERQAQSWCNLFWFVQNTVGPLFGNTSHLGREKKDEPTYS